jgi:hypothetical protein
MVIGDSAQWLSVILTQCGMDAQDGDGTSPGRSHEITRTKSDAKNPRRVETRRCKCQPGFDPGFKRVQNLLN